MEMVMANMGKFDRPILFRVLLGTAVGTAAGIALLLWAVPATSDYRPAVLSTVVVPLGCFWGWLLSGSRERASTAALACFGLYFLSAFAAARLGTLIAGWSYFPTVIGVQSLGGVGIAMLLGFRGRALPQVEQLRERGDVIGLGHMLHEGSLLERREAARALGALGRQEARPALLHALDDTDLAIRQQALAALVGLAQPEDRPRLETLRQHPDRRTQRLAREVLHWIE
jgi:hypothetical protein